MAGDLRGLVVALLVAASGCRGEANLDLILIDGCSLPTVFAATQSVRVSLVAKAAFNSDLELSGCLQQDRCLSSPDQFVRPADFRELRLALARQDVLLTTSPGTDQAVVVAGYSAPDCRPPLSSGTGAAPIQFCGYNVGTLADVDARLYIVIGCDSGEKAKICWTTDFLSACQH